MPVNLGFNRGTELTDPARALLCTGKQIRQITIRKLSDLDRPPIRRYLKEARSLPGGLQTATRLTRLAS